MEHPNIFVMTCQWLSGLTAGIKLVQRFLKYFRFRLFYGHVPLAEAPGVCYTKDKTNQQKLLKEDRYMSSI